MLRIENLKEWLNNNKIVFTHSEREPNVFVFFDKEEHKPYLFLEEKDGLILNQNLDLILDKNDLKYQVEGYIFNFGGKYFVSKETKNIKLKLLKHIYFCSQELDMPFTHLGVHGPYEILNGAFQYNEWVKKAKFLNHTSLGICEKNTLAGIFLFQKACEEANIKPIF